MKHPPIVIFGTGKKFQYEKEKHKALFEGLNIIAYLDNNQSLWGNLIEGIPIIPPSNIGETGYDKIVLMADYVNDMKNQLIALGVSAENILLWDQFLSMDKHGMFVEYGAAVNISRTKEKVLLISVELEYNGGTIAIINAAKALQMRGYDITLAAPNGDPRLIQEINEQNIRVVIVPAIHYPQNEEKEWIKQFDIVVVNVFQMIRAACVISHFRPLIWWIHESSEKYMNIYSRIRDNQQEFDNSAMMSNINIMAVSSIAKRNFNYHYPARIKDILTYGIPDTYARGEEKCNKKYVFAVIGDFQEWKAQTIFIDAIQRLNEEEKENSNFWIIGKSRKIPYAEEVYHKAEKFPEIKLLGELTRKQMQETYKKIDVVVCCSLEETMSLTITEGMMNEKLCITTDATGIADYIKDEVNGLICKANDAESLCQKMKWILANPNKHKNMKENARKTYEKNFSMDIFGENLEKALNETKQAWRGH